MNPTPVLFLDIDGVLNGHDFCHEAQSCLIRPDCVRWFNHVLRETGCRVVLSSAWRYMVHGGAMTISGFGYMLRTHGVAQPNIVGVTCKDEDLKDRGEQISDWLERNTFEPTPYAVVDDDDYDIRGCGHPLVRTDPKVGMTQTEAGELISILNGGPK